MLPPDWQTLGPLLDAVLDAPAERRSTLILELCAGDSVREGALRQLLAECERETPLLDRGAAERFDGLAHEATDSMLPELIAERYRVGRVLGSGGMARVYLARDLKHGREVAIKVIRPELAASLGHERFLREIEIAARLRHPNIVPLYDSGQAGDALYFVMPYEEGESLRARLEGGPLPVSDALSVLRDVARALAYAHEHGVVHRDVKPDNVMLSGGAAVVTDFGIAKAVSAALTDVSGPTLTQSGSAIGTPAYMAPEQATGDPSTDHRADIYAFGCVAYEVFTGQPPFADRSMHLVIAAHLATTPRPVGELRADAPHAVAALIARCLEKDPAARPQNARELVAALDGAATTGSSTAPVASTPRRGPVRVLRWAGAAVLVGVVSGAVYLGTRGSGGSAPITLAVLPFGNIGADSTLSFVAEGLADEVAGALARVPGIQIKSRNGARNYRNQLTPDLADAGVKLKADYLMTGVVRQERGRWILSAEVARAADAASLWGENFNVGPDQAAGAAELIARSLTLALHGQFPRTVGTAPVLGANTRTTNNEAYRLYLRGQGLLDRRGQSVSESAELFRQAIHQDTLYALAYSGLSMALVLSPYFQGVSVRSIQEGVATAARRAIELDPTLAQPHIALGILSWFEYEWDRAGTEFETALRLDGRNVEARVQYARHLMFLGRNAEAMEQMQMARVEDPSSALVLSHVAYLYYVEGRMDSALVESRKALENDSANMTSVGLGALVLLGNNLPEEARKLASRASPNFTSTGYILAKSGDTAAAWQRLRDLDAVGQQPGMTESKRAYTYLGLGDTANALAAFERATARHEIWQASFGQTDPILDPIRNSARYKALLRRVGRKP